ncbi:hypothetical protein [Actibacterium sp. 188UL27-1]|uniref:hypothetical protein n=1 Tax=Actibacterium sp. 188UL27-1 TaxID=2786961 RepID=UPI00195905E1|nr:hypothetical protein [Actibacterium sp. 188UL27-1]MBM7069581.1 hypothetical protein [Actibacterium sp. 188UL27-1]
MGKAALDAKRIGSMLGSVQLRAMALDRLGLITLLSSFYFFQVWGLTNFGSPFPSHTHYGFMVLSAIGIVLPRLWWVLVLNAIAFSAYHVSSLPVASNNQTTAFFFSLIVVEITVLARPIN